MPLPGEKPPPTEPDELSELPPLDGGEEDPPSVVPADELDENPDTAGADPFDDSTGEDETIDERDLDIDDGESGWMDDANEDETLDVGGLDTLDEEAEGALLEDADEPGTGGEELLIADEGSQATLDAGEEGFDAEDEDLREEDLPRLDVGDDAELDEGTLFESPEAEEDTAPPPWNDRAWRKVELTLTARMTQAEAMVSAGTTSGRGVLVASADGLARLRVDAAPEALPAAGLKGTAPISLAVEGARVLVAGPRVGLAVSKDGGASFVEANAWRALCPRADADAKLEVVLASGEIWGLSKSGVFVWSGDDGVTWNAIAGRRGVALASDGKSAALVAREGTRLAIGAGEPGKVASVVWSEPVDLGAADEVAIAAREGTLALRVEGRGAFRVENGAWSRVEGSGAATAIAIGDGGSLLVALGSSLEAKAWLAEAPAGAPLRIVAEIGDGESQGGADPSDANENEGSRIRFLVWDEAAGAAWVGGGFGVAAFRR